MCRCVSCFCMAVTKILSRNNERFIFAHGFRGSLIWKARIASFCHRVPSHLHRPGRQWLWPESVWDSLPKFHPWWPPSASQVPHPIIPRNLQNTTACREPRIWNRILWETFQIQITRAGEALGQMIAARVGTCSCCAHNMWLVLVKMGPTHRIYTPEFNDIEEENYMEENLNIFILIIC